MSRPLVHAIIGCGRVAPCHVDAFRRLSDVRLKYSCAGNIDHATVFARAHGIELAASWDQILNDDEVTTVSIATPHDLHVEMAEAAVQRGKHVLIEKPMGINVAEIDRLIAAVAIKDAPVVMPVAQHRFDPPIQIVARLLRDGLLGRIVMVRAHLECFRAAEYYTHSQWRGKWAREGGSVLINQAYHILDLVLWLGGDVKSVASDMHHMLYEASIETEEALTASFRFEQGAVGALSVCGSAGSSWQSSIEIIGQSGVVGFTIGYPPMVYRLDLKDRRAGILARQALKACEPAVAITPAGLDYYGTAHRDQVAAFVAAVRTGTRDPHAADLDHSRKVIALANECYASAQVTRPSTPSQSYV